MKEVTFRITQEQLANLGGLLAAKATEDLILCECGKGEAAFSSSTTRQSWSYRGPIRSVACESIEKTVCGSAGWYCVISPDLKKLTDSACPADNCLWCCWDGVSLNVFVYEKTLIPVDVSMIVGNSLKIQFGGAAQEEKSSQNQLHERTIQAFGRGTRELLSHLTIGIAGVSGTGSIVAEQLFRLGVKRLILVDDDYVEERNLGRILYSSVEDATNQVNKAIMLKNAFDRTGLETETIAVPTTIGIPSTVRLLSQCDLLFGCLDSADGRMQLNRISTFYSIPYIDLGVKLKSDYGTISEISGSVRYLIPGQASLMSIGAISQSRIESDALLRDDPIQYRERLKEKYIEGAHEGSPAVISVNMSVASLAVLELLNRVHEYRDMSNHEVEVLDVDLLEMRFRPSAPGGKDNSLVKYIGRGDCVPLLNMPGIGV